MLPFDSANVSCPRRRTFLDRDACGAIGLGAHDGGPQLAGLAEEVAPAASFGRHYRLRRTLWRVDTRGSNGDHDLQVILLGTAGGLQIVAERLGISTLMAVGSERLLFDAERSSTTGLARLAINPVAISKIFLTHLHSDHIISLPELLLFPWTSGRTTPLSVWGPAGTRAMMQKLQEAP